jgi:hypothetical protein
MERRRVRKKRLNRRERGKGRNSAKHGHTKDAFEISGLENTINALSSSPVFSHFSLYCWINGVSIMSSERRSMGIRRSITIYYPLESP